MDIYTVFQIVNTALFGLFGLVIGSFLNVCIYRLPEKRTIVKGHSMCMTCGHELGPLDLFPLLSWLFLRGKCRYCRAPIASRYAIIEGLTGFVFAVLAWMRRDVYIFPGASDIDIVGFLKLILLLGAAVTVIVAMMIQKDRRTGMYRFSLVLLGIAAVRLILAFFDDTPLWIPYYSSLLGILISLLVIVLLAAFVPSVSKPVKARLADAFNGNAFRDYFHEENRPIRITDSLVISLCVVIGGPADIILLFCYFTVRSARKPQFFLPYLGIIVAASAFLGLIFLPNKIF